MKYVAILFASLTISSCELTGARRQPAAAPQVDEFDILRLRIMERMAGGISE